MILTDKRQKYQFYIPEELVNMNTLELWKNYLQRRRYKKSDRKS